MTSKGPISVGDGEVIMNLEQQARLAAFTGMGISTIFKLLGVPGFAGGGVPKRRRLQGPRNQFGEFDRGQTGIDGVDEAQRVYEKALENKRAFGVGDPLPEVDRSIGLSKPKRKVNRIKPDPVPAQKPRVSNDQFFENTFGDKANPGSPLALQQLDSRLSKQKINRPSGPGTNGERPSVPNSPTGTEFFGPNSRSIDRAGNGPNIDIENNVGTRPSIPKTQRAMIGFRGGFSPQGTNPYQRSRGLKANYFPETKLGRGAGVSFNKSGRGPEFDAPGRVKPPLVKYGNTGSLSRDNIPVPGARNVDEELRILKELLAENRAATKATEDSAKVGRLNLKELAEQTRGGGLFLELTNIRDDLGKVAAAQQFKPISPSGRVEAAKKRAAKNKEALEGRRGPTAKVTDIDDVISKFKAERKTDSLASGLRTQNPLAPSGLGNTVSQKSGPKIKASDVDPSLIQRADAPDKVSPVKRAIDSFVNSVKADPLAEFNRGLKESGDLNRTLASAKAAEASAADQRLSDFTNEAQARGDNNAALGHATEQAKKLRAENDKASKAANVKFGKSFAEGSSTIGAGDSRLGALTQDQAGTNLLKTIVKTARDLATRNTAAREGRIGEKSEIEKESVESILARAKQRSKRDSGRVTNRATNNTRDLGSSSNRAGVSGIVNQRRGVSGVVNHRRGVVDELSRGIPKQNRLAPTSAKEDAEAKRQANRKTRVSLADPRAKIKDADRKFKETLRLQRIEKLKKQGRPIPEVLSNPKATSSGSFTGGTVPANNSGFLSAKKGETPDERKARQRKNKESFFQTGPAFKGFKTSRVNTEADVARKRADVKAKLFGVGPASRPNPNETVEQRDARRAKSKADRFGVGPAVDGTRTPEQRRADKEKSFGVGPAIGGPGGLPSSSISTKRRNFKASRIEKQSQPESPKAIRLKGIKDAKEAKLEGLKAARRKRLGEPEPSSGGPFGAGGGGFFSVPSGQAQGQVSQEGNQQIKEVSAKLADAISAFPNELSISGNVTVQVEINGGAFFSELKPEIANIVMEQIKGKMGKVISSMDLPGGNSLV
jgi:hypothetical protein